MSNRVSTKRRRRTFVHKKKWEDLSRLSSKLPRFDSTKSNSYCIPHWDSVKSMQSVACSQTNDTDSEATLPSPILVRSIQSFPYPKNSMLKFEPQTLMKQCSDLNSLDYRNTIVHNIHASKVETPIDYKDHNEEEKQEKPFCRTMNTPTGSYEAESFDLPYENSINPFTITVETPEPMLNSPDLLTISERSSIKSNKLASDDLKDYLPSSHPSTSISSMNSDIENELENSIPKEPNLPIILSNEELKIKKTKITRKQITFKPKKRFFSKGILSFMPKKEEKKNIKNIFGKKRKKRIFVL